MCKIIAIANQKGGVAKTTTTINLGVGLSKVGKRVMLIDADPQGHLTMGLGFPKNLRVTLKTMMENIIMGLEFDPREAILHHEEGIDVIPSNKLLSGMDMSLFTVEDREKVLKEYLELLENDYDYILIDCMPSLGMMTINALKVLYGLMLDRMALSIRHQWFDEEGKVYIIFTVEQVIQYMNCGRDKAMKTLAELDTKKGIGLIERVKQGFGKPDIIYVKNFILRTSKDVKNNDESEESIQQNREVEEVDLSESEKSTYRGRKNRLQGVGKTDFKRSENTTYRGRKIRTTEVGKIDPINTKYNYTDISNTDRNNTDLINLSDSSEQQSMDLMEEMELFQMNTALVKRNIEYDCLVQRCRLGEQQQLDEIVALIVETISIERENITISGVKYPYQFVKSRLLLLEESHIEYVLDCLHENTREVKNIKAYLLTCLMNSITTIGNYYQAKVNHDMYGGGI